MRLLLINYEYPPIGGGAGNATQALAREFVSLGHEVEVLTSHVPGWPAEAVEGGLAIHRLWVGRTRPDRARQWEMAIFLARSGPAALRLHRRGAFAGAIAFFTIPSGPGALRLRQAAGVPYLVSLRGGDVPGHVPGLAFRHRLTRRLRRAVLSAAAAVVANSESLAETSRAADPFPVAVVPNGVDCRRFFPGEPAAGDGPLRLLFVGRVHGEKNLGLLFDQLARLGPGIRDRFELRIAGDGAQKTELQALAARLGIASRIHWLGWQPKDAIPALYRSADVLVNPSQYEGMPNGVLEAMASGLAVLASDVPGNRSVVEPEANGVVFPLDRPESLGAALRRLEARRDWVRALGQAGRRRAEAEFSWLRSARSYLELLSPSRSC